jgi:flagella basal body P-ring formation protein FlgA
MNMDAWFVGTLIAVVFSAAPLDAQQSGGGVPTAARTLERGAVLSLRDLDFAPGEEAGARDLVGWVTRRVIAEGESLRPPAIAPGGVIRSGDEVQVIWAQGGLEVRMAGRAMNAAAAGERVNVRLDGSRRLQGVALGAGRVRLDSPGRSSER